MSQCDSTMHNSRSEQQGGDTGPAEPPLFLFTAGDRVRFFLRSHAGDKGGFAAARGLFNGHAEIASGLWLSDLACVDASSRAAFLTICSFSPTLPVSSSWCLCCPGVPFGCSSGHEQNRLSLFARLRNISHVWKLGLGTRFGQHTFIALRILGRTVNKVRSRRSAST